MIASELVDFIIPGITMGVGAAGDGCMEATIAENFGNDIDQMAQVLVRGFPASCAAMN